MSPHQITSAFESFGARIGVAASDGELLKELHPSLPPGATPVEPERLDTRYLVTSADGESTYGQRTFDLTRDGESVLRSQKLRRIRKEIESDLHFRVANSARGFLFVHAGVAVLDERAMVIPGRTLSGKSTLVLALVRAGADYYSDEYAVFDRSGLLHSYPKPLSERTNSGSPKLHPVVSLGLGSPPEPRRADLIMLTRYQPGWSWFPRTTSKAEAMMALFDNTVVARTQPEFALEVLCAAVRGVRGLEGTRGEAAQVVRYLLDERRPPRAPEPAGGEGDA